MEATTRAVGTGGDHAAYPSVKQQWAGGGGLAALRTLLAARGVALLPREIGALLGVDDLRLDVLRFLFACRKLGLEAVPLEGEIEELAEVPRPCVVTLREAADDDVGLRVLHEMDASSVLLTDPENGTVIRLDREAFAARWTGDAIQVLTADSALEALRAQIAELRSPRARLLGALGLSPPSGRSVAFLVGIAVTLGVVGRGLASEGAWSGRAVIATLGGCLALSLWSLLRGSTCSSCSRTAALAGRLPIAPAGVALYASLLALAMLAKAAPALAIGLWAAVGVHASLLAVLYRARIACFPCIATAALAFGALVLLWSGADPQTALHVGIGLLSGVVGWFMVREGRRLGALLDEAETHRMVRAVAAEPLALPEGRIRIVVYKQAGCPICAFFTAALRPSLEAELGEQVSFDERDVGDARIVVPLVIVRGTSTVALLGVSPETGFEILKAAIEVALRPNEAGLTALGGVHFV